LNNFNAAGKTLKDVGVLVLVLMMVRAGSNVWEKDNKISKKNHNL
jgi:cytochrome b561